VLLSADADADADADDGVVLVDAASSGASVVVVAAVDGSVAMATTVFTFCMQVQAVFFVVVSGSKVWISHPLVGRYSNPLHAASALHTRWHSATSVMFANKVKVVAGGFFPPNRQQPAPDEETN
jgi:hypothetical protein